MDVEKLLELAPFEKGEAEKLEFFMRAIRESALFHYKNCERWKTFCESRNFNPSKPFKLEELPLLPVGLFKRVELLSVPREQIVRNVLSSSTTSSTPSSVLLDKTTMDRQVSALTKIMGSFLGNERRVFIVFDARSTVSARGDILSSRGTAIRGMIPLARKMHFVLNDSLELDEELLKKAVEESENSPVCFFGFTWLLYNISSKNQTNARAKLLLSKLGKNNMVLHIGGWKKLKDLKVSKEQFNAQMLDVLGAKKTIDTYGMTEQLGTIYPDCEAGYKHVSAYSEIIIRDVNTLEPCKDGKEGFIQLISPIPHSYPGISLLSEDMGKIIGRDNCKCGRAGAYFIFTARHEKAELKGCGDTLKLEEDEE
ncbi:MAG: hypothetical protein ABIH99_04480 [Candidatus Micrarchaeota archaeon]